MTGTLEDACAPRTILQAECEGEGWLLKLSCGDIVWSALSPMAYPAGCVCGECVRQALELLKAQQPPRREPA
jgi:hypothetical protein